MRSWWSAVLVVAATYFYFLIFAEFAFLEVAKAAVPSTEGVRGLMLALGAGGILGSIAAARGYRPAQARIWLRWSLRACALAGAATLVVRLPWALSVSAFAVGASLGALTVVLAASLRAATSGRRLGLCVGLGTGLAYALCNVPIIFRGSAVFQTSVAVLAVAAASFLPRAIAVQFDADQRTLDVRERWPLVCWVAILLVLVWMDSAAFYIVQHTPALRSTTWGQTGALWMNAGVHLLAAVGAGVLLDRGWRGSLVAAAVASLAVACLILNGTLPAWVPAAWCYTAGVSLYSTVLVEMPARTGRATIAAIVFAVAGWFGSALGIGMAQDLARVPVAFVMAAVITVAIGLRGAGVWRLPAGAAVVVVALLLLPPARADEVARGREVYIAEGCIHCHSQYVRPGSKTDVLLWGPAVPLAKALEAEPPLFGNRRLGPDLSQVGNRRSVEWNRVHLVAPQAISPGSRMPSYAHLFSEGDTRGEALLAYLASLGGDTLADRWAQTSAWKPDSTRAIAPERAAALFQRLCTPCHGPAGRGDGPMAERFSLRPPDWTQSPWRHVRGGELEEALARIIKFGLPGLPMAGHEYLPDAEILGLARTVKTLHKPDQGSRSAALQP